MPAMPSPIYSRGRGTGAKGFSLSSGRRREGITINGVEPGHVWTEGAAPNYDPEFKRAVENFIPMGRFGEPEDIGKTVLFLASDDASYITGQTFVVDGGVTLPEYPPRHARNESR
jgi:3-oxoacyl-[acyl-carrier protein] reductase